MNTSPAMAPLSPVIFSPSTPSRTPHRPPSPALMTSPKLWQKASISRLAEEFFWIGGSIVATPKWRIVHILLLGVAELLKAHSIKSSATAVLARCELPSTHSFAGPGAVCAAPPALVASSMTKVVLP
ncbi:hypothetical protein AOLI_G00244900 [Acnodon oligacanthus]